MNKEINHGCFVIADDKASYESLEAVAGPGNVIQLDSESVIRSVPLKSFWYLASPYSKYEGGKEKAYTDICDVMAWLVSHGVHVFCPIAHTHQASQVIAREKDTHDTWLKADMPFIVQSVGLLICKMPGWEESFGVKWEIDQYRASGKPIRTLEWPFNPEAKPTFGAF